MISEELLEALEELRLISKRMEASDAVLAQERELRTDAVNASIARVRAAVLAEEIRETEQRRRRRWFRWE